MTHPLENEKEILADLEKMHKDGTSLANHLEDVSKRFEEEIDKVKCNPGDIVTGWVIPLRNAEELVTTAYNQGREEGKIEERLELASLVGKIDEARRTALTQERLRVVGELEKAKFGYSEERSAIEDEKAGFNVALSLAIEIVNKTK